MIVLWIFIGILFALLLLLCFPLTLAVSYADKISHDQKTDNNKNNKNNKNEEEEEEEEEEGTVPALQDLPKESTESILAQLILEAQETLKQQQKPEKEYKLTIIFLCFKFQLFPQKPKKTTKPQKEKPVKKEKPESAKKKKKKSEKEAEPKSLKEIIDFGMQIWERSKRPLKRIFKDLLIHHLELRVVVCKESAADTAIGYGVLQWIVSDLLATASNYVSIRKTKIDIQTDFSGDDTREDIAGAFRISIHPIIVLGAVLQIAVSVLLLFMRFSKPIGKDS